VDKEMRKIKFTDVKKLYGDKTVINKLSLTFSLQDGAIGVIGPNGAGKTTIFKMLAGILLYNKGNICIEDNNRVDINSSEYVSWAHENIAFIPASDRDLSYKHTVYDNIIYYGLLKGVKLVDIKSSIAKFAISLQAENILQKRVESLSTGQKKNAQLLCALCSNLSCIVLDEPTSGLDIDAKLDFFNTIKKVSETRTVIISSHDIEFLSDFADTLYFIFDGKLKMKVSEKMKKEEIYSIYEEIKRGGKYE
jgi:ABC-type multidrug transport system ATPase subunit